MQQASALLHLGCATEAAMSPPGLPYGGAVVTRLHTATHLPGLSPGYTGIAGIGVNYHYLASSHPQGSNSIPLAPQLPTTNASGAKRTLDLSRPSMGIAAAAAAASAGTELFGAPLPPQWPPGQHQPPAARAPLGQMLEGLDLMASPAVPLAAAPWHTIIRADLPPPGQLGSGGGGGGRGGSARRNKRPGRVATPHRERGVLHHITQGPDMRWKAQLWSKNKMYYSRRYDTAAGAARAADLMIYKAQGLNADTNFPLGMDVAVLVDRLTLEQVGRRHWGLLAGSGKSPLPSPLSPPPSKSGLQSLTFSFLYIPRWDASQSYPTTSVPLRSPTTSAAWSRLVTQCSWSA